MKKGRLFSFFLPIVVSLLLIVSGLNFAGLVQATNNNSHENDQSSNHDNNNDQGSCKEDNHQGHESKNDNNKNCPSPTPSTSTTFTFPSCESLIGTPGDRAHYTDGLHQIVGGALLQGSDDVYSLDNGNFVQCFCPPNGGAQGIQTNWLRSKEEIEGWFFENGLQWNLGDYNYAAQNHDFSCTPPVGGGESTPSASSGGGVGGGNEAPLCSVDGKPQNVDQVWITDVTQTSLIVHWANKGDASGYQLAYGPADNKYQWGVKVGNVNSYQINGIPAGLKVVVTVVPLSGDCSGNASEPSGPSILAATGFESNLAIYVLGMSFITAGIWQAQNALKRSKKATK